MALKFETPLAPPPQQSESPYKLVQLNNIGMPHGIPPDVRMEKYGVAPVIKGQALPPVEMPGANLKRAVNYYADYGGCGWWRMIMPEMLLNITQKAVINGVTCMVLDPRFYQNISSVRLQRQATPIQLEFVKFLKAGSEKFGFRTIYEIDDVIFMDDIPLFNRCRTAFEDPVILQSSLEMMRMCDEISVTCEYMKNYYIDKTGNKNITVIPNYPAKMWFNGAYNEKKVMENYEKNKKLPRILYAGSGTHIDVANRTNQRDDFSHVVDTIIQTRKMFKWVFVGAFPLSIKPFIDNGEMEFIQWFQLKDLAQAYTTTNVNAVFAPLQDCVFNRAKSNIKYLESACCGVPGVFQDMITYEKAPLRFKTGAELIDQMKFLMKDANTYSKYSKQAWDYANTMWLDDHLDEYTELYFTPYGSPERKALLVNNPEQLYKG